MPLWQSTCGLEETLIGHVAPRCMLTWEWGLTRLESLRNCVLRQSWCLPSLTTRGAIGAISHATSMDVATESAHLRKSNLPNL